jgi:hypothetical protein
MGVRSRLLSIGAVGALLALPPAAHGAFPGPNGPVVFESHRDGRAQVYVMQADGSAQRNLGQTMFEDRAPAVSPDRAHVAFVSDRGGDEDVWVMDGDGGSHRNLSASQGPDTSPSWAPDGRRVVFASGRGGDGLDLYVQSIDGGPAERLTHGGGHDWEPVWSPDGSRIAWLGEGDGGPDIFVAEVEGWVVRNVTATPGAAEGHPDWSPDGTRLVFWSDREGDPDVFVAAADGTAPRNLTDREPAPVADYRPVWSPDGRWIAWNTHPDGEFDVWAMRADGTQRSNLTRNPGAVDVTGSWATGRVREQACDVEGPGGWALRAHASADDGVVVEDVRLGPRLMARKLSLPYFEVHLGRGRGVARGELTRAVLDPGARRLGTELVRFDCVARSHAVVVEGVYSLDLPGRWTSTVTQRYVFERRLTGERCEPTGRLPCARWWPTVRFDLAPGADAVRWFRSVQRFELAPDGTPGGTANLFHDHGRAGAMLRQEGVGGLGNPVMKREDAGEAYRDGAKLTWDNYHQSARENIGRPGSAGTFDAVRSATGWNPQGSPGCAECVHIHWHWGRMVNEFRSGFTDDRPMLLDGSRQSARWAVTRKEPMGSSLVLEDDPVDTGFEALVDRADHRRSLLVEDEHGRLQSRAVLWFDAVSPGIRVPGGGRYDEVFPDLQHVPGRGGRSSAFFAPGEHLPKARAGAWTGPVRIEPQWGALQRRFGSTPGLPAGWILPVDVSLDPAGHHYDMPAVLTGGFGVLKGPFYLMARSAGPRWLNPDAAFRRNPVGDAYTTLREDGRIVLQLGYERGPLLGPPRSQVVRVLMAFDAPPAPGRLDLELVRAPAGGEYRPWEGFWRRGAG